MSGRSGKEFNWTQGVGQATHGSVNATVLSAPGAGDYIYLEKAIVTVYQTALGVTGYVALEDGAGGTRIWRMQADTVGSWTLDFGERGYKLSAATLLNLNVFGGGDKQAAARCTAFGHIAPDGY
ncbi:MAG: hypothetical protein QMD05_10425 [Candidatus Brocadiaceae bacterium]|nr:hypothetical protein [Candidatus Brocadiaceae bacterium]